MTMRVEKSSWNRAGSGRRRAGRWITFGGEEERYRKKVARPGVQIRGWHYRPMSIYESSQPGRGRPWARGPSPPDSTGGRKLMIGQVSGAAGADC